MNKSTNNLSRSMRSACAVMGVPLVSTDHFVAQCFEWLSARGHFTIEFVGDSWNVKGATWFSGDERLSSALCGAVFCVESQEQGWGELNAWDAANSQGMRQ